MDETGAATGNVKEISGNMHLYISANKYEFGGETSFNQSNSTYTAVFYDALDSNHVYSGNDYNKDNSTMDAVIDNRSSKAVAAVYVSEEEFAQIDPDCGFWMSIDSAKETDRLGFKYFTLIISVLFFVFILITCLFIKEKSTVDVQTAKISDMFKALVQNDQAMTMVLTIVLVNSSVYITSNLLIYFFKYDLGGASWQGNYTLFNTFGGGIQILAMMIFFPVLRKFFDTIKIFYISVISAIVGYLILLVMALGGISIVYPFLVPAFFIFGAVGILNVLVTIFLANTVDYGEIKNNRRDESVIFSMQTFVVKLASGIAALVASVSLSIFNISSTDSTFEAVEGSLVKGLKTYIENIGSSRALEVSGNSVLGLRFVMTVLPMVVLVIAILIFKARYTLNDEKLAEISKQIEDRRKAE
ncbi:MAG: MFS transporter [Lachnospiraceae bacterium]|nr:MFS transporter [Lachnospiraceae bacterium]